MLSKRVLIHLAVMALISASVRAESEEEEIHEAIEKVKHGIHHVLEHAEHEEHFVEELFHKVEEEKPEHFNVVVLNTHEEHEHKLYKLVFHEEVEKFGHHYGIWIFKCGKFENEGKRDHHHYKYSHHHVYEIDDGEEAIFYNEHCPNHEYREKHQKHD